MIVYIVPYYSLLEVDKRGRARPRIGYIPRITKDTNKKLGDWNFDPKTWKIVNLKLNKKKDVITTTYHT